MSKKRFSHLRGERGQAFADLIRGIPSEQILCVSLDISKYFHVVMIHNGLGEIVKPTFEIDFYQSGFDQLCQAIDQAKAATQAQVVLVGMEPTSHYFENLARHLLQHSQPVTLVNSFAVKQNRDQQLMRREKTDPIDCAAIGDLLRRIDFWQCQTLQHLIRVCPDPHLLANSTPEQLVQLFKAQSYRLGRNTAAKIIARAQQALLPDPELVAIRRELLHHDLILLEAVQAHIAKLEQHLTDLVAQTPFQVWTHLKGLSAVQVASLAAAIGDPANYSYAGQIFRRSGLVSGRNDSGNRQRKGKGNRVLKVGDVYLRRALMSALNTLLLHQPLLSHYYRKLSRSKPAGVTRVATARKANSILWATLRDQYPVSLISCKGATM